MFFFGHTGIAVGAAHLINNKYKTKLDLRLIAILGIGADLIDKPIGLAAPEFFHYNTRLVAHNIFAITFIVLIALAFLKKSKVILIYLPFYLSHLLLDQMWSKSPDILFFPFAGPVQWHEPNLIKRWGDVLKTPYTLGGEIVGFLIWSWLVVQFNLYKVKPLDRFLSSGELKAN